jgi:hypothetical protein
MFKKIYLLIILTTLFLIPALSFASKETTEDKVKTQIARISIPFIENTGQIENDEVSFYAKTFGGTVFITKDGEIVYSLPETPLPVIARNEAPKQSPLKGIALKEILLGEKVKEIKGEGESVTKVSYFKGNNPSKWKSNISTYNLVNLGEVYDGIGLKLKAYGNNVEKLFYIKAGANPEDIKLKLEGAKRIKVNEKGELEAETELGIVKFTKPVAYQEINGKKVEVATSYLIPQSEISNPQFEYGFKVGDYDRTKELVIDPLFASSVLSVTLLYTF